MQWLNSFVKQGYRKSILGFKQMFENVANYGFNLTNKQKASLNLGLWGKIFCACVKKQSQKKDAKTFNH